MSEFTTPHNSYKKFNHSTYLHLFLKRKPQANQRKLSPLWRFAPSETFDVTYSLAQCRFPQVWFSIFVIPSIQQVPLSGKMLILADSPPWGSLQLPGGSLYLFKLAPSHLPKLWIFCPLLHNFSSEEFLGKPLTYNPLWLLWVHFPFRDVLTTSPENLHTTSSFNQVQSRFCRLWPLVLLASEVTEYPRPASPESSGNPMEPPNMAVMFFQGVLTAENERLPNYCLHGKSFGKRIFNSGS